MIYWIRDQEIQIIEVIECSWICDFDGFDEIHTMFRRFSVQSKIVFPYTLLFAAVIAATALVTIVIVYRQMDRRIEEQMGHVAENISGFLLSDDFLRIINIKAVLGADIIAYEHNGLITATTLDRNTIEEVMSVIRSSDVEEALYRSNDETMIRDIRYLDQSHKVVYRRVKAVGGGEDSTLSLIVSMADIDLAKRRFRMIIGLVAISGVLLVAIVGSIIARSITAPVKQLVEVTEQIAGGNLEAGATVRTSDEIGALASSINEMTRELKTSRDKLVQSEKLAAVGQLAAGIAHEIRNPLTSVKMIVQLLRGRFQEDEAGLESVQAILDEIDRLEIIINGLLDFARPMELALKPTNVADVMNDVLRFMEADMRHRKIELINRVDETLPEVMLDADRMKQVFMNVILNAMQAMPEGGELNIDYHYDAESRSIQMSISDTGLGMSQEVLDHAFDPFFSTKSGGAGLGLANVRKIMEQHGGDIRIETAEGQGTKVAVDLRL
ncbi:ATP-binding protein [Candidatus Poribacteria bacterium]